MREGGVWVNQSNAVSATALAITFPTGTATAPPAMSGTYHLAAGTYYWTSLQLDAVRLYCDGPVKIYVADNTAESIHLTGGASIYAPVNATTGFYQPGKLGIFTAGGIHVEAGSTIYGTAIAEGGSPGSYSDAIHLEGGSHWYGAVATTASGSESVHIEGGATVTYDTQLGAAGTPAPPMAQYWQRF